MNEWHNNEMLTSDQLQSAYCAFHAVFREYLGILKAIIACRGSCDGEKFRQQEPMIPMIFRGKKQASEIPFTSGFPVKLYEIGIDPNMLFSNMPFDILPTPGISAPPLKMSGGGFVDKEFFAVKFSKPPKDFPDYFAFSPIWSRPIDDVVSVSAGRPIPNGYILAPEIIVSPESYLRWLMEIGFILEYRITPINQIMHNSVLLPKLRADRLAFPNNQSILLYESKFCSKIPESEKMNYPSFRDAYQPLIEYETSVEMALDLVKQEIQRRKITENALPKRENIADRLKLREGQPRELIFALDNDRMAGKPVDANGKCKELGLTQTVAKIYGEVKNYKGIDKADRKELDKLFNRVSD